MTGKYVEVDDLRELGRRMMAEAALIPDNPLCTTAGWYWYCDQHDTHGNADSEREADAVADAHHQFHVGKDGESICDINVFEVKP